jgi:UDP-N-acetylglucosamine 2-epimerase (non-hydrolysing)
VTNVLVGNDPQKVLDAANVILHGPALQWRVPEKWDGKAAERIVEILLRECV